MKDRVIVTTAIGDKYAALWDLVRPTFEDYADRIGSDLLVIENNPHGHLSPHWTKLVLHGLLHKRYRRAIWMDSDLVIRSDCPDLFDLVPQDKMGLFNEGRFVSRTMALLEASKMYGVPLPTWDRRSYYNTGVMVVSQDHRHIFSNPDFVAQQRYGFGEQTYLNMRMIGKNIPIHELSHHFNRMSLMDTVTGVSRLASYIVHYAGYHFTNPGSDLGVLIRDDLRRWGEDGPSYSYSPTLFIHVGGGLGDQVCAEPVLRYIHDVLYPDADIYVTTTYPELFTPLPRLKVSKVPWTNVMADAVHRIEMHPSKDTGHGKYTLNVLSHPVDYISMEALERTLPASAKSIHLEVTEAGTRECMDVAESNPEGWLGVRNLVLVHPGVGWLSKTFPQSWWQEVANLLATKGYRVGVIGRDLMIKVGDTSHAYLPITVPPDGVDFRDRLSTEGLIALLSKAPVLISNDSAPIHLAGAFDNWIVLIPTCKHPEHVLPYRRGSQWYKAVALYRSLACEEYCFRPTEIEVRSVAHTVNPIETYLPLPSEVVESVITMLESRAGNTLPFPAMVKGERHEHYVTQSH